MQHQRALPRAVRPEERHLLTARNVQVHAANRFGPIRIAEVEVLNMNPVIVTRWLTVVLVWMRVRGGEIAVRMRVAVLEWVALATHRYTLGSSAPAAVMATKAPIARATLMKRRASGWISEPSESEPLAPRAVAASSTRPARA